MSTIRRVRLAEEEKFVPKKDLVPKKNVEPMPDKKAVKNQKPFTPDDSAPEFDPSREESLTAETTVPSEIQALDKDQQKHIMTADKKPGWRHTILDAIGLPNVNKLWDKAEDFLSPEEKKTPKIPTPVKDEEIDDEFFAKCNKTSSQKPKLVGKELKANWNYLASVESPIEARDDVFYAKEDKEDPEEKE